MTEIEGIRREMLSDDPPSHWNLRFKTPTTEVVIAGFGHTRAQAVAEARDCVADVYKVPKAQVEEVSL